MVDQQSGMGAGNAGGMTPRGSLIDEIVREGARRMPATGLKAEVNGYMAEHLGRDGTAQAPRLNDMRVGPETTSCGFSSGVPGTWGDFPDGRISSLKGMDGTWV